MRERQEQKKKRKQTPCGFRVLCLILPKCAASVNCARADGVTSDICGGHFWFV